MKKNTTRKEISITSLKQLRDLSEKPITVRFALEDEDGKQTIKLTCHRLGQAVREQVDALQREAQPKWSDKRKDYDLLDKTYLAERDLNNLKARSLMVYTGCPAVAAEKPGLTDVNQIYEFVRGLLADKILQVIALKIEGSGITLMQEREVAERANFTSTADSED